MSTTSLLEVQDRTLGPLSAGQRSEIMRHAPQLSAEARRVFRRLLMLNHPQGLNPETITRAAAQARAHFEH